MTAHVYQQVSKPISRLAKSGALNAEQVWAAIAIEDAIISILTNNIRSGFIAERPKGRGLLNSFENMFLESCTSRQAYYAWIAAMKSKRLPAGPVLDVIVDGIPLTVIDKRWRKRKGWARVKLTQALDLYLEACVLKGNIRSRLTA